MARVERSMDLNNSDRDAAEVLSVAECERTRLRVLVNQLAEPQLNMTLRLQLVAQMRGVLDGALVLQ